MRVTKEQFGELVSIDRPLRQQLELQISLCKKNCWWPDLGKSNILHIPLKWRFCYYLASIMSSLSIYNCIVSELQHFVANTAINIANIESSEIARCPYLKKRFSKNWSHFCWSTGFFSRYIHVCWLAVFTYSEFHATSLLILGIHLPPLQKKIKKNFFKGLCVD